MSYKTHVLWDKGTIVICLSLVKDQAMMWVRPENMQISNIHLSQGRGSLVSEEMKTCTHSLLKLTFQFIWYPRFVRQWDNSSPNVSPWQRIMLWGGWGLQTWRYPISTCLMAEGLQFEKKRKLVLTHYWNLFSSSFHTHVLWDDEISALQIQFMV